MRITTTLNESEIAEAIDLALAKGGMKRVGDLSVGYTPPGGDRPSDPASFSITVEAETVKLPPADPLDEPADRLHRDG